MWISDVDSESGGWGTIFFDVTISGFHDSAYSFILGEYAAKMVFGYLGAKVYDCILPSCRNALVNRRDHCRQD